MSQYKILADKMREGAAKTLPLKGRLYTSYPNGLHACALGCVALACGVKNDLHYESAAFVREVESCTGIDIRRWVTDPLTGVNRQLIYHIIDYNDLSHWTRERIADWIETL